MSGLVLSLFPGIGLLDRAFEEEGFCVVRGPDKLWGGDVHRFHAPAGRFDGVIGGPPCQRFSSMGVACAGREDRELAANLIPEYERIVGEAQPTWFVMENVPRAPLPVVPGYGTHPVITDNRWHGGTQARRRRFTLGSRAGTRWALGSSVALEALDRTRTFTASGWQEWNPETGKTKPIMNESVFREGVIAQGLPADFDLPGFTVREKIRAVGNGVPLAMGRAVACAVKLAMLGCQS